MFVLCRAAQQIDTIPQIWSTVALVKRVSMACLVCFSEHTVWELMRTSKTCLLLMQTNFTLTTALFVGKKIHSNQIYLSPLPASCVQPNQPIVRRSYSFLYVNDFNENVYLLWLVRQIWTVADFVPLDSKLGFFSRFQFLFFSQVFF